MIRRELSTQKLWWVKQALILSGILNILFLGIFFYFLVRENPFSLPFDYAPAPRKEEEALLPKELLRSYASLTFEELKAYLKENRYIQDGYRARDFALSILVYRDQVDIQRALGKKTLSERSWKIDEKHTLPLFPGLEESDFEKIQTFLTTEEWPFTSYGQYCFLKKQGLQASPSLLQSFCQTPEFLALETLFGRTGLPIKKGILLALACEIDWKTLCSHLERQKHTCDFSDISRREILVQALDGRSRTAAYLFLLTDYAYALKQLDDPHACLLLDLLGIKTEEAVRYAKEMTLSLRGDEVKKKAEKKLHCYGIHIEPERPIATRQDPRPGISELRPNFRDQPSASPTPNTHIVQPGESLWLIAKKYRVSIEELIAFNRLSSTTLQVGKLLKIPTR